MTPPNKRDRRRALLLELVPKMRRKNRFRRMHMKHLGIPDDDR